MFIDVGAKPGDLVITDSGFVGTVKDVVLNQDKTYYTVVGFEKNQYGSGSTVQANVVFTQTWEYRSHAEKQATAQRQKMMDEAQKVCDKFISLRDLPQEGKTE